jgi:RloB-like protein
MPSPRRNRDRRPARRSSFREPKPIILIVCEGKNTEPQYFDGFQRNCRNPRVEILVAREHGVPRTLVETAKEHKKTAEAEAKRRGDENLAYDSVWCVFDVDEHPHIPDARQMARDNDIELAISNPCFELWLLLHFRDSPGMRHRRELREMFVNYMPGYDKGVDYAKYSDGYLQAVKRATRLATTAANVGESGRNPSTDVYKLTEIIRGND